MKAIVRVMLCVLVMAGTVLAEEQKEESNLQVMGRGFVNIVTSPLELFRWMAYDGAQYTVPGIITGPLKGTAYTAARLVGGVGDVLSLGFLKGQHSMYAQMCMKDYVWEEKWWPATEGK